MDKIIEILRRFLVAITLVVGGGTTVFCAYAYFKTNDDFYLNFAFGAAGVTVALYKLVNWILLKED